jgi:hypothetical protein
MIESRDAIAPRFWKYSEGVEDDIRALLQNAIV